MLTLLGSNKKAADVEQNVLFWPNVPHIVRRNNLVHYCKILISFFLTVDKETLKIPMTQTPHVRALWLLICLCMVQSP